MTQFAFLFRKSSRKLSEAEDKRRGDEVRAWGPAGQRRPDTRPASIGWGKQSR